MYENQLVHFPGIDGVTFNREALTYLWKETNLAWCGFYLPVINSKTGSLIDAAKAWTGNRSFMKSLGWGLAPIYLGKQFGAGSILRNLQAQKLLPLELAAAAMVEAQKDATEAVRGALKEGFNPPTVIYFDCELPGYLKGEKLNIETYKIYMGTWANQVRAEGFNAGIYCHQAWADDLRLAAKTDYVWAVEYNNVSVDPHGDGGYARAAKIKEDNAKKGTKTPVPPVGQNFDPSPGLNGTKNYPTYHPNKSGNANATSWQMAAMVQIPYRNVKTGQKPPRITVDMNTSVFSDPGLPYRKAL